VFVRTDLLRLVGGWDAECLAEDCELGIRLSVAGARTAVAYTPALATREETPPTLTGLLKQRTRWNQGYLQVLQKGEWQKLPSRSKRMMARYLLAMPFMQAFAGALVPLSLVTMVLVKAPVMFVLFSFLPMIPTLATLVVEIVGLAEFNRMFDLKVRFRDYLTLVVGTVPYQLLLAYAAVRASARELRGQRNWEKTEHVGAHRSEHGMSIDLAAALGHGVEGERVR
jgi:glycosyltransferase XagB